VPFPLLPAQVDLPALEHEVLRRWHERAVFPRSLERTADGEPWIFYEGPPTANGKPGTHHVEARAFKDLFPRYQTMRGRHVPRRAGWDCHGLPVELAVEKELGFTNKHDIEVFGIAAFNERCRESVGRHVDEFGRLTERMGYWVDMSQAYRTMDPSYIESVWWSLQQIYREGLLVEDYRVAPYCPRCQTGLSDHEVAQGYTEVTDPSVYVRLPVIEGPEAVQDASLLVWTTTPWTLVSNVAVAAHPDVVYVVAEATEGEHAGLRVVVAEPLVASAVGEGATVHARLTGRELAGTRYRRPLDLLPAELTPNAHRVVLADYVTTEDGTGLVHQSPAFGAEDMAVARANDLPVVNPIEPDGTFAPDVPLIGGVFFKAADAALVAELRRTGLLWRYLPYTHSYPLCWRCDTALLYYAQPSWYIRTTARKEQLLAQNAATDWHPETIRDGRYGEWLRGNVDWALSRKRYWGTPLPIWRCDTDPAHLTVVGSLAELGAHAGQDLSALDPHRPYVDDVVLACREPGCGGAAHRVPEVIDGWYDSGSMPFAQLGYPHRADDAALRAAYPADFICEAVDQTRGWFYTLMAIGTLVFDQSPYRTVLCLGHIVDADGRKMSKHLGNVLDPFQLFETYGADAVRWLMLAQGSPWSARRVGHEPVQEVVRQVLLTYWNTVSFLLLYARANDWEPTAGAPAPDQRHVLDRWLLQRLDETVAEVTEALDAFDTTRAGRALTRLLDETSNWYVRRSRRRFWAGDPGALATLHQVVVTLTKLLAPFVPFVTDAVWEAAVRPVDPGAADSVHLTDWPTVGAGPSDAALVDQMALVRRVVELGRAARADSGVKTRQPLRRLLVAAPGFDRLHRDLVAQVAEELNVVTVETVDSELASVSYKPAFRVLGKVAGKRTKDVAALITEGAFVLAETTDGGERRLTLRTDDAELAALPLTAAVLLEQRSAPEGFAAASDGGVSVALDLELTDELRRDGTVRDVVRLIQEQRKAQGLDVTDRIDLWWTATGEAATALRERGEYLAGEVLALSVQEGHPAAPVEGHTDADLGVTFWLRVSGS
jgi:isoleucyl-tRNA synthetase